MDNIEFNKETKTLAQLFGSSYYQSHKEGQNLSIEEISSDLYKLQKLYDKVFLQSIRDFDGYTRKDISKKSFTEARNNIENEMNRLISNLKIPSPITDKTKDIKKPYLVDTEFLNNLESTVLHNWYEKYQKIRSEYVYKFQCADLERLCSNLFEIGKFKIKIEACQKVTLDASFEGIYLFEHTFENVPDACRYLDTTLEYVSFDAILKNVRSDEIKIFKAGKEITDGKTLYDQVYSWWQNEKNKGRNIPKG